MLKLVYTTLLLHLVIFAFAQESPVLPRSFNYYSLNTLASNGSSLNGKCSNITYNINGTSTCNTPSSSVLFDGHIPTLTGLGGDTWANELMMLRYFPRVSRAPSLNIYFDFPSHNVRKVEVTMFQCPQWNIGAYYFAIIYFGGSTNQFYPSVASCDSLVKICVQIDTSSRPVNRMFFYSYFDLVHIAEIAFYESNSPCPFITIIPGTTTNYTSSTTVSSATTPTTNTTAPPKAATELNADEAEESDGSFIAQPLLSVLVAITALQTTVILIVVVAVIFLLYKYSMKQKTTSTPVKPAEPAVSAIELRAEDEMYETVEPEEKKFSAKRGAQRNPYTTK